MRKSGEGCGVVFVGSDSRVGGATLLIALKLLVEYRRRESRAAVRSSYRGQWVVEFI